jgi:hypothetical protein
MTTTLAKSGGYAEQTSDTKQTDSDGAQQMVLNKGEALA